jgi:hypothetical protein
MIAASDTETARERSKALFGAQYRVEVGAAIARGDGLVCIKDLADELGGPPGVGSVNAELRVLERSGLLVRGPRDRSSRKVYLLRQPSSYWEVCLELLAGPPKPRSAKAGGRGKVGSRTKRP